MRQAHQTHGRAQPRYAFDGADMAQDGVRARRDETGGEPKPIYRELLKPLKVAGGADEVGRHRPYQGHGHNL